MIGGRKAYKILAGLLALSVILAAIIIYQRKGNELKVIFLDVGQGDAILIEEGSNQILIDGGRNGKVLLEKLGRYVPFWDRTIETVVATHPDQDHIGGLIDVMKSYNVGAVLETRAESDSQTFKAWQEAVRNEKCANIEALRGLTLKFSEDSVAQVLYPLTSIESPDKSSTNQYSVVIKLQSADESFLFTGDLPAEQESELIKNAVDIQSYILKVAHHGSRYSTSEEFIEAVKPEETVISVGKNNSYGHPSPEVIERLLQNGVKIYRTDEMGDIIYKCNPPASRSRCKLEFN